MLSCEIAAEPGDLDHVMSEMSVALQRGLLVWDEAVEQIRFCWGQGRFRRRIWRGAGQHGHPEDPPTQDAEDGDQLDQSFGCAQPAAAAVGIDVDHQRRRRPNPWPIVDCVTPEIAGLGLAIARPQHRQLGLVRKDLAAGEQRLHQVIVDRPQPPTDLTNPASKRRAIKLDAAARQDLGLPVRCCVLDYVAEVPVVPDKRRFFGNLRNIIF